MPLSRPYMDPAWIKGILCFALVMCAAHLLRPLYLKILDPPLLNTLNIIHMHLPLLFFTSVTSSSCNSTIILILVSLYSSFHHPLINLGRFLAIAVVIQVDVVHAGMRVWGHYGDLCWGYRVVMVNGVLLDDGFLGLASMEGKLDQRVRENGEKTGA